MEIQEKLEERSEGRIGLNTFIKFSENKIFMSFFLSGYEYGEDLRGGGKTNRGRLDRTGVTGAGMYFVQA